MGKAERRVSLTKEEIKALCEEAADKAVERSEKARKRVLRRKRKPSCIIPKAVRELHEAERLCRKGSLHY